MKKSKLVCAALPLVSSLFVACTPIDVSNLGGAEQKDESSVEASAVEVADATDASSEADSAANETDSAANDSEFYYEQLKDNEKKEVDLGNDGKQDTLLYEIKDTTFQMKINEQVIDLDVPSDNGFVFGGANVLYVHKTGADYLILETYGDSLHGTVTLYKWDNGSMKKLDELDDLVRVHHTHDEKTDSTTYEVYADKIVIAKRYDVFGSWIGTKDYTYGDDGFATEEKADKLQPFVVGGESGLILKKDITFTDDSGEAPKTAKAGETIYPCEIKQNTMGFNSKSGEFLGYIPFEYNEDTYTYSSNGVSEQELFENNLYIG
jgi:hypothetical protein